MSRTVTGKEADQAAQSTQRVQYTHGLLKPITAVYFKWADKDANKNKIEGTGGEVEYDSWVKLPDNKRGQRWDFEVDPNVIREVGWTAKRGIMLGFADWNEKVAPSIMDTVGQGEKSVGVFADRAAEGTWYVEAEMVFTGYYNEKPQNTFKFIKMTQDINQLRTWNAERYPKQVVQIPDELIDQAKLIFTKMAKGNADKFNQMVSTNDELNPYIVELSELSKGW